MPLTKTSKKDAVIFKKVPCIYYLISFKKNEVQALFDIGNEIYKMILAFKSKVSLKVLFTNIKTQKIYSSTFKTFEIASTSFRIER